MSHIFLSKTKLVRHRIVNTALRDEISSIHAFTQVSILCETLFLAYFVLWWESLVSLDTILTQWH